MKQFEYNLFGPEPPRGYRFVKLNERHLVTDIFWRYNKERYKNSYILQTTIGNSYLISWPACTVNFPLKEPENLTNDYYGIVRKIE